MHTFLSSLLFVATFSFNLPGSEACTAVPLHVTQNHGQGAQPILCTSPNNETVSARLKRLLDYEYDAPSYAVARGVQSVGNLARLQRIAEKVLAGESVGVGVAGGSFSTGEGDIVSRGMAPGYFGRFTTWLKSAATAPGQEVTNLGGGIGAIMSPPYAACASKMTSPLSDVVFVEFAVNDQDRDSGVEMGDSIQRLAYERTIRNILNFPHQPAVVVYMNMLPGTQFGRSVESDMMVIAQHYQLPVLSARGAFYELMKKKVRTFRVDGNQGHPAKDAADDPRAFFFCRDNRHAGPQAYQYLAELAIYLFQHVCINLGAGVTMPLVMMLPSMAMRSGSHNSRASAAMQAARAAVATPLTIQQHDIIRQLEDIPEPIFPGNKGSESRMCVMNEAMRFNTQSVRGQLECSDGGSTVGGTPQDAKLETGTSTLRKDKGFEAQMRPLS